MGNYESNYVGYESRIIGSTKNSPVYGYKCIDLRASDTLGNGTMCQCLQLFQSVNDSLCVAADYRS